MFKIQIFYSGYFSQNKKLVFYIYKKMSLVKKILVANRGQIACRIIKTAKRMGIKTVAIHSDIDKHSKFVQMADQAYRVGHNPSSESYLNSKKILQVALESNCQALHPGFGFLSENAKFAEQCVSKGVKFIGPPPSAITAMGSKSQSKKIMTAANVPVVPGYHQQNQQTNYLYEQALQVGYPVLIKAVSGGGGKGMRIVRKKQEFLEALDSCKRESLKSFSDDRVLIQKYITKPRHIQVQIFGDMMKNYVHLYERDCSIQRRHQKVVEQAPSNISDTIRNHICHSAVEAAKAVGYYNAGTVEFIFDLDSNKHYFMEMNTRLQVEHPISQMITGLDFVQWQFLVASGFPLPKKQSQIQKKGNAIEVRIYSQDPFNNFLPNHGKLQYFKEPKQQKGVRIQTGVRENDTISTFYDPMIAKLITYGQSRTEAMEKMKNALEDYKVVGLKNNLKFLKRVFQNSIFQEGQYDTSFIQKNIDSLLHKDKVSAYQKMASVICRNHHKCKSVELPSELLNFRNVKGKKQHFNISVNETSFDKIVNQHISLEIGEKNHATVYCQGKKFDVIFNEISSNVLKLTVNGQTRNVQYFADGDTIHIQNTSRDFIGFHFDSDKMKQVKRQGKSDLLLKAPMPGIITKVYQKAGNVIKKGDSIIAMQAMKMQLVIKAEFDCKILKINAGENEFVEAGKQIVELVIE